MSEQVSGQLSTPGRDAGFRLRRLLAVLAVLARDRQVALSELAARFDMTPTELASDLQLAACCGLPPYTPDQLMEIVVDDTDVTAFLEPALARPRRLTPVEGLALLAAARAILAVPGADTDGALGRAVAKLEAVVGSRDGLRVDLADPEHLGAVRGAADRQRQLSLRYHSASRDEVTERVVDPIEVRLIDGCWYLDGFCHRARSVRRFRVDRILRVKETGLSAAEPPAGRSDADGPYVPSPDATVVRLEVDDEAAWVLDAVPTLASHRQPDGRLVVDLAVSSRAWLGRLLVRLGPHGVVLAPPELVSSGVPVASRILARYETA